MAAGFFVAKLFQIFRMYQPPTCPGGEIGRHVSLRGI